MKIFENVSINWTRFCVNNDLSLLADKNKIPICIQLSRFPTYNGGPDNCVRFFFFLSFNKKTINVRDYQVGICTGIIVLFTVDFDVKILSIFFFFIYLWISLRSLYCYGLWQPRTYNKSAYSQQQYYRRNTLIGYNN